MSDMAGCAARVCGRPQRELPRYKAEMLIVETGVGIVR
jgi:hypothetical protein